MHSMSDQPAARSSAPLRSASDQPLGSADLPEVYRERAMDPSTHPLPDLVRRLDWNLLRTFVVVAECRGVTAAAAALHLAQPTVSNAIRRLETTLGRRLIERREQVFTLTAEGEDLLRYARDVFATISRIDKSVSAASPEISGRVELYMTSHVVTPSLDALLAEAFALSSGIRMSIEVCPSSAVVDAVASRRASLGICLGVDAGEDLASCEYYRQHFGLYCGKGHPLFGRKNLSPSDLNGFAFVSFQTDTLSDALHVVARFRARHNIQERLVATSPYLEEVRRLIRCGVGIGPLPVHIAREDEARGVLTRLPPYDASLEVSVHVYWNPRLVMNSAEAWILERIKSASGAVL